MRSRHVWILALPGIALLLLGGTGEAPAVRAPAPPPLLITDINTEKYPDVTVEVAATDGSSLSDAKVMVYERLQGQEENIITPTETTTTTVTAAVVFVVDRSYVMRLPPAWFPATMQRYRRLDEAINLLGDIISGLDSDHDRLGIVTFNTKAELALPLQDQWDDSLQSWWSEEYGSRPASWDTSDKIPLDDVSARADLSGAVAKALDLLDGEPPEMPKFIVILGASCDDPALEPVDPSSLSCEVPTDLQGRLDKARQERRTTVVSVWFGKGDGSGTEDPSRTKQLQDLADSDATFIRLGPGDSAQKAGEQLKIMLNARREYLQVRYRSQPGNYAVNGDQQLRLLIGEGDAAREVTGTFQVTVPLPSQISSRIDLQQNQLEISFTPISSFMPITSTSDVTPSFTVSISPTSAAAQPVSVTLVSPTALSPTLPLTTTSEQTSVTSHTIILSPTQSTYTLTFTVPPTNTALSEDANVYIVTVNAVDRYGRAVTEQATFSRSVVVVGWWRRITQLMGLLLQIIVLLLIVRALKLFEPKPPIPTSRAIAPDFILQVLKGPPPWMADTKYELNQSNMQIGLSPDKTIVLDRLGSRAIIQPWATLEYKTNVGKGAAASGAGARSIIVTAHSSAYQSGFEVRVNKNRIGDTEQDQEELLRPYDLLTVGSSESEVGQVTFQLFRRQSTLAGEQQSPLLPSTERADV